MGRPGAWAREYLPDAPPATRRGKSAQEAHEAIRPELGRRASPRRSARFLDQGSARALPADLGALPGEPDACRRSTTRWPPTSTAGPTRVPRAGPDHEVPRLHRGLRGGARGRPTRRRRRRRRRYAAARGGRGAQAARRSIPSSTSPSRRRASPRPRWSSCWRSGGSAGRPPTRQILGTIQGPRLRAARAAARCSPTELGMRGHRPAGAALPQGIMDVEFTAQMEEQLDKIEEGDARLGEDGPGLLQAVLARPQGRRQEDGQRQGRRGRRARRARSAASRCWSGGGASASSSRARPIPSASTPRTCAGSERPEDQPTDEICPTCGKPMVIKHGRFGKFIACSGYPECKTTKPVTLGHRVPEAGLRGQLVERRSRKGRTFFGCTDYPDCKFVVWQRPVAEPCPKCARAVPDRADRARAARHAAAACGRAVATGSARPRSPVA